MKFRDTPATGNMTVCEVCAGAIRNIIATIPIDRMLNLFMDPPRLSRPEAYRQYAKIMPVICSEMKL